MKKPADSPDRPAIAETGIEFTSEMIEAGSAVLLSYVGSSWVSENLPRWVAQELAVDIFREMSCKSGRLERS